MQQKVLVVDDDRLIREILKDLLIEAGFLVVIAGDGEAGVKLAQRERPDVILLDLYMPKLDGSEVCRILRQDPSFQHVPILLLTSRVDRNPDLNPFQLGADDYLAKPVEPFDLISRIRGSQVKCRTLRAMAEQAKDHQALVDISAAVSSSLDTKQILKQVVGKIAHHLGRIERCSIALIQEDEAAGYVVASSDDDSVEELRIDLGNYPEIRKVMEDGIPLRIRDIGNDSLLSEVRPLLSRSSFDALLVCPVHCQQQIIGVMIVRAERHGEGLTERELEFCQLVADVSASPLRNARSFYNVRNESEQLRHANLELERVLRLKGIFHDLFDNASEGLVAVNREGRVAYANHRARLFLGIEKTAEEGKIALLPLLEERSRQRVMRLWLQRKASPEETSRFDVTARSATGGPRMLSVSLAPRQVISDLVVVSFRDVTHKRNIENELHETRKVLEAANQKLEELDRMRSEFLNTATHELRIPVTIVHGYCSLLQELGTDNFNPKQKEFLQAAVQSSDKLVDLVNNMLDISRLEAGKVDLDISPRDLHQTISEVCESLKPLAEKEDLALHVNTIPNSQALYDEDNIQRVLTNLLGNAIKFTPDGGQIKVLLADKPDIVKVMVEDTGKGIPSDRLEDLFEEFSQLGKDDAQRGSGLGLAICKRIVEHHGGQIWAECLPGQGSRFSFTLPKPN